RCFISIVISEFEIRNRCTIILVQFRFGRKARRDEPARKGTLQHAHLMRHDAGRVESFGLSGETRKQRPDKRGPILPKASLSNSQQHRAARREADAGARAYPVLTASICALNFSRASELEM